MITEGIDNHKVQLRSHIIEIRDQLREAFDEFFNNLLATIRKDWNLFSVQESLVSQSSQFNQVVVQSLKQITQTQLLNSQKQKLHKEEELRKFYEQLSDAQVQVQNSKEDWQQHEQTVQDLMACLRDHSEFDVCDKGFLKSFMTENFVMNFSNIDYNKIKRQHKNEQ